MYFFVSPAVSESAATPGQEPFLRLLENAQGKRLDEQRAGIGNSLPGLRTLSEHNNNDSRRMILSQVMASTDATEPDDQFFDMLVKCQVRNCNAEHLYVWKKKLLL